MSRCLIIGLVTLMGTPAVSAQLPPIPDSGGGRNEAQPRLYVAERNRDIGIILEGDVHTLRWVLENRGSATLTIDHTQASCGCVVARLSDDQKVIPAGESRELTVDFNSHGRRGIQKKSVTIVSDDPTEPRLKLQFTADVRHLYIISPQGVVNLRAVRRGEPAEKSIDIAPGPGRHRLTIVSVEIPEGSPVTAEVVPIESGDGKGRRILVTVGREAALGPLQTPLTIKLDVDGIQRERVLSVRAEVVGDLTWHPRIVDQTRSPARPGKRFAPITLRSTIDAHFSLIKADAGPWLDVDIEPKGHGPDNRSYAIILTLRDGAPPGPFAASLNVRTDSLDQPLIQIPVFAMVTPPIQVDPPVILLRAGGSPAGTQRRVKLRASPQTRLIVSDISCDLDAVEGRISEEAGSRLHHVKFLTVFLNAALLSQSDGETASVLTVTTNVRGAERLEIPVIVDTAG